MRTAIPDSSGGIANSFFLDKKQKDFNVSLFPDSKKLPPLNKLWDVVSNYASKTYLKSQGTVEKYIFAASIFFDCLYLIVYDLHLDQLMVIFCATVPIWYDIATRIEKSAMIKTFKEA